MNRNIAQTLSPLSTAAKELCVVSGNGTIPVFCLIVGLLLLPMYGSHGSEDGVSHGLREHGGDEDWVISENAVSDLVDHRERTIGMIRRRMAQVSNPDWNGLSSEEKFRLQFSYVFEKVRGVYLLGVMRSSEDVGLLLNEVVLSYPFTGHKTKYGAFPAAIALVRVGLPSVEPSLQRLSDEGITQAERRVLSCVLICIHGKSLAKQAIERALTDAEGTHDQTSLRAALKLVEATSEDDARRYLTWGL